MLVYADDVALHQWVGPVAVDILGLFLCAACEEVVLPDEMCEVTPVLWIYESHVLLEDFTTKLHLRLQAGLVAGCLGPGGSGLCVETVGG